ncbi:SPFH domain-containing protein [Corynebacterium sp.]|uniref:SPFH domain-containing protein n=1 Tax=Corynebacterium sp. TaxID=1720 RepID=UPI0034C62869
MSQPAPTAPVKNSIPQPSAAPSHTNVTVTETPATSLSGAGAGIGLVIIALLLISGPGLVAFGGNSENIAQVAIGVVLIFFGVLLASMVRVISPGHTLVVQFFGKYKGTVRADGLHMILPLHTTKKLSVRVRNFETETLKVNDLNGNPVNIGAIVVWQIADTAKATFAVEDVEEFIHSQAESALRHVATTHPYDSKDIAHVPSLSGSTDVVSEELASEVSARTAVAGIDIVEARVSALAYAPEIAQSMLQRQQAAAVVDARETIVEGAVTMVDSALQELERREIVDLDPERRAAMVSNLLVVLCSDTSAQPVVNTGSLYS